MRRETLCNHVSPVVVNPVEGGGWRGHCLCCGKLGPVGANSVEALDLIQRSQETHHPERARRSYGSARRD